MSRLLTYGILQQSAKFAGLLNLYPDAVAAFSLRKLRYGYRGYCIEVRRDSDNTTSNIGFSGGVLNTSALLAFVGSGNGYITKWYDQSGNGYDAIPTDNIVKIVNSGNIILINGKPSLYNTNSNCEFNYTGFDSLGSDNSLFIIFSCDSVTGMLSNNNMGGILGAMDAGTSYTESLCGVPEYYANSRKIVRAIGRRSILLSNFHTGDQVLATVSNIDFDVDWGNDATIMTYRSSDYTGLWYVQEYILFDSNEASKRFDIETKIASYYNMYYYIKDNGIIYKSIAKTEIIYALTTNTGALEILSSVITIAPDAFLGCSLYSSLIVYDDYDCDIFNEFIFADFSGESLDSVITNLKDGTIGNQKYLYITINSKTSLLAYNSDSITDAATRYINIINVGILSGYEVYYPLINNRIYNSSEGYDLTLSGEYSFGIVDNQHCFTVDGINGYAISNFTSTTLGTNFTISMWIYMDGYSVGKGIYAIQGGLNSGNARIILQGTASGFRYYLNGGWRITETVSSGVWIHIALTYDGTTWRSYVNGNAGGTYTGGISGSGSLFLGNGYNGYFKGSFRKVAIYLSTLDATAISNLYNS